MGGGKETPRQKMIGMMYLVLLALLAMNVSKEVLSAFVTLDKKMYNSLVLADQKNDGIVNSFDNKITSLKAEGGSDKEIENIKKWQRRALRIRKLTNDISNYLVTEAGDMIKVVEPYLEDPSGSWITEDDSRTSFPDEPDRKWLKLHDLDKVQVKDNYDAPTNMFIGETMFNPVQRGKDIRLKIHAYRDSLAVAMATYEKPKGDGNWSFTPIDVQPRLPGDFEAFDAALDEALQTVNPEDKERIRSVYKMLTLHEFQMNHGKEYPWVAAQFDHSPIVAAAAIFTALKVDCINAETIALEHMANKIQVQMFNFNKIEPLAFSKASYVNRGDSVNLSVMIAAYDSARPMKLRYWINDPERKEINMKTYEGGASDKLALPGSSPGKFDVTGQIEIEVKGAPEWKDWDFSYTVGEPSGTVSLPKMNVLYRGYDNEVSGAASGFPGFELGGKSNVSIKKKSDGFIANPGSGREAAIDIIGVAEDGSKATLGTFKFRVQNLPAPSVYFGALEDGSDAAAGTIRAQTRLFAKYPPEIPLEASFSVVSWEVNVSGAPKPETGKGMNLTPKALGLIKQARKGSLISFMTQVKGPDGKIRKKGASFKVK